MGKYAEHLADRTKLLCGVMQKENQMGLGTPKEKEFREIKSRLISLIIYFKIEHQSYSFVIITLTEKQRSLQMRLPNWTGWRPSSNLKPDDQSWRPLSYSISMALTPKECRYA